MQISGDSIKIFHFGSDATPAEDAPAARVGNKAANLIRMAGAGLPVPPGFVLPTELCREYFCNGQRLSEGFRELLELNIRQFERSIGLQFAGQRRPLLVSVRSGAAVSMPGMLDTVLNIGLCDRSISPLIRMTGNPRLVWDSYRRLVQAYGEVVCGLSGRPFEAALQEQVRAASVQAVGELDALELRSLTRAFQAIYQDRVGAPFPQEPREQLAGAVEAVFRSWQSHRAVEYRRLHKIDDDLGTAVTVQAMVFGNIGGRSGSGVAFTRNPSTGENQLYLDFLRNAQGEDVVSGRRAVEDSSQLQRLQPALYRELQATSQQLEQLFRDAQDFEFTVQEGRLHLLQSRAAQRTPWAALRIACELQEEGLIDQRTALDRLATYDLDAIRLVRLAPQAEYAPLSIGVPASPGVAVGELVFDAPSAVRWAREGGQPILVRPDISTDDIGGLAACSGILTATGGRTSHAAVVARQLNKVCIVGCRDLQIERGNHCRIGSRWFGQGEEISLDGDTGRVYAGKLPVVTERPTEFLSIVQRWRQLADAL